MLWCFQPHWADSYMYSSDQCCTCMGKNLKKKIMLSRFAVGHSPHCPMATPNLYILYMHKFKLILRLKLMILYVLQYMNFYCFPINLSLADQRSPLERWCWTERQLSNRQEVCVHCRCTYTCACRLFIDDVIITSYKYRNWQVVSADPYLQGRQRPRRDTRRDDNGAVYRGEWSWMSLKECSCILNMFFLLMFKF